MVFSFKYTTFSSKDQPNIQKHSTFLFGRIEKAIVPRNKNLIG